MSKGWRDELVTLMHWIHHRVIDAASTYEPLGHLACLMRKLGPYAAVALIVPGGSLIALTLWAFRRPASSPNLPSSGAVHLAIIRTALRASIAFVPLLASCANSGLYNMSDEWCARHSDATAAHCPRNQELAHRTASRA